MMRVTARSLNLSLVPFMRITWFGHAAFGIVTHGQRIIIDPYRAPDCGGYAPINAPADLVLVSHENDKYH